MQRQGIPWLFGVALVVVGGCQPLGPKPSPTATVPKRDEIRANCYSLLHDLLKQEKNVNKLLLIKWESTELDQLIKTIASVSGSGAKQLEEFAARDPLFDLEQLSLPLGEVETRSAMASTKQKELLWSSGADFEWNLLLAQAEALSYAWHLSKVAAANESQPGRALYFVALSDQMKDLHQQTVSLMRARSAPK